MDNQTTKPYVIGLGLGGTNSVFGIVDAQGTIKASTSIKTKGLALLRLMTDFERCCIYLNYN